MTDEVRTARRAERFAVGSHAPGTRTDAYVDPAGQDLLARLLLAVTLDGRPISDVDTWLTRPTHETAVDVLRAHGFPLTADQVAGVTAARSSGGRLGTPLLGGRSSRSGPDLVLRRGDRTVGVRHGQRRPAAS